MADEKDLNGMSEPESSENLNGQQVDEANAAMEGGDVETPPAAEGEAASDSDAEMMAMLEDLPEDESKADVSEINFPQQEVSDVEFQHLSEPAGKVNVRNIDMLMDVNLPISIELGRTKMSIADILGLGPGSVVELNKLAGEPVDLLVNQRVVAKGEVVVVDENFGVRVTQLMTPEERLKALGEES